MTTNGFELQYAIQMPDGTIMKQNGNVGAPLLWETRDEAESYMQQLTASMGRYGVNWQGRIVWQYMTPFVGDGDPSAHLIEELSRWLKTQGGQG